MARTHAQKALLKRTLKKVEQVAAKPGRLRWDQGAYREAFSCGAAMCFAGWACQLESGRWLSYENEEYLKAVKADNPDDVACGSVYAGDRAARLLGLAPHEALELFDADNTLADLRRIVRELTR